MKSIQDISYKTLFTILFFSLAGIVFFLRIGKPAKKVSATWWDEMWHYRKAISIENTSGSDLTDFQVAISIGTSQLITEGKMQTDCDDIRITDINGNLLPHWIEENNPGCNQLADTKIWLKANSLPTSGATIYIYYGNQQANNSENGDNVFEFFDDFSDFSNWTGDTNLFTTSTDETRSVMKIIGSATPGAIFKPITIANNYIVEVAIKDSNETSNAPHPGLIYASNGTKSNYNAYYIRSSNQIVGASNSNIGSPAGSIDIDTNWHTYKTSIVGGTLVSLIFDNTNQITAFNNLNITTSHSHIGLWSHDFQADGFFDSLFIRKYASSDPTPSFQSEEISPAPIAYWKFDEGSGSTAYDTMGNNNANLLGTTLPEWQNEDQCISGKCLFFNGSAYINTNFGSGRDISTNPITVSMWVNPISAGNYMFLAPNNGTNQRFYITTYNGKWDMGIQNTGWGAGTIPVELNKWTHIVVVTNGSTAYMYANGKLTRQLSYTPYTFASNLYLGQFGTSSSYRFYGYLDEVKIYPYARTTDQIKQDYNSRGSLSGAGVNLGIRSNTAPSIKSSLIAYYKFDENNGTTCYDSSGNNVIGTFTGTTIPTWSSGKYNSGVNFNGVNSYIDLGNSSPIRDFTDQITVSIWAKYNAYGGGGQSYSVLAVKGSPWTFLMENPSNKIRFRVTVGGIDKNATDSQVHNLNQWYHFVGTYDGQNIKIYKNGILAGTTPATGNLNVNNVSAKIGTYTGTTYNFNGLIDEVKIYNRALTAEEIKQDYNQGSVVQFGTTNQTIGGTTTSLEYCIPGDTSYCAPPIAEWKMDEGIGTSIIDTSGNNNIGNLGTGNSAPSWTQGKIGKSTNFTGSQFVTIEDSSSLKPTSSITAEAWFNVVNKSTIGQRMLSKTNGGGYQLSINENSACPSNTLCFLININGSYYSATYPSSNLSNNTWYHVSGSYDGSTVKLFLNGINIGTTATISNNITQNTAKVCLGSESAASNCYTENGFFNGKIDHVKIYNYARTPAQIAYDYNKGSPVGWWKLDECQGSIAYDWSGIGNTGVINIGPSGTQNSLGTCAIGTSAAWSNGSTGKINSSLNFDGTDDYINIGNQSELQMGTGAVSVSHWIKLTGLTNYRMTFFGGGFGGATGYGIGFQNGTTTLRYETMGNSGGRQVFTVDGGITLNKWHHVTGIFDGINNVMKLYVDGIQKHGVGISDPGTVTNNSNFSIGSYNASQEYFFNGQIDDVRVYNYVLTEEQVKQVYNGGAVNFQ